MKCVISGASLGVWCRVIQTVVQVGDDDVFFDFAETIMTISSANSSLSTFSTFILFKPFFTSYSMTSNQPEKVAIPAKIILKPYRSQKMAKNHVSSEIRYGDKDNHITIASEGKSHASSTYRLNASEHVEEIQFDVDPYSYRNCLKVDAKVLAACLANFSHMKGLSELTLKIQGQRVILRNTVTDVTRKDGSVVTEYNLTAHDFIDFEVQDDDVEYAFGFREFKLYATFAEQLKLPVNIHFQSAADPVIIIVKMETFEARLVMATRVGDPFNNLAPTPSTASSSNNGRISNVTSQNSGVSSRTASGISHEMNRQRENRTTSTPVVTNTEPPPAKRIRRTEAAPPLAELPQPNESDAGSSLMELPYDDVDSIFDRGNLESGPVENIGQLVENLEKKNSSDAFKAIQRLIHRPRMSETEYLKTLPGHDVILCPESDDEDSK